MSSPVTKGMRRSASRRAAPKAAAKSRSLKTKSAKPKLLPKRKATAKAPAKKAQKVVARSAAKPKAVKKAPPRSSKATKVTKAKPKSGKKVTARKSAPVTHERRVTTAPPRVKKTQAPVRPPVRAVRAQKAATAQATPTRQPTADETAALQAFDRAHREFTRGRFQESRNQFRILLERFAQVSEVAARARTYLAVSESRLRTESMLPRDADSLYDRGVIELNRGEYVAAQEMFERALKREPEAAHIHYGLAATRARLGSIDLALQSLQRALDLQPNLRVRAQHDQDLTPLRNDPDFDKLIFAPRL
jgi:tetratricopeptide (TPR) repeat protein